MWQVGPNRHLICGAVAAMVAICVTPARAAPAAPAAPLAVSSVPGGLILAQAGSTGGSIGKSDKSLSGGQDSAPPPSSPPPRSKKSSAAIAPPPLRGGGGGSGGGGKYDGTWTVVSVSPGCQINSTATVVIAGGRTIAPPGLNGQVSSNGSTSAVYHAEGYTSHSSGRLSGRSGSGSFTTNTGCVGRWTAAKQ